MTLSFTVDGFEYFITHTSSLNGVDEFILDSLGEFYKKIRVDHNDETVYNVNDEDETVIGYYELMATEGTPDEIMERLVKVCVANEYY